MASNLQIAIMLVCLTASLVVCAWAVKELFKTNKDAE